MKLRLPLCLLAAIMSFASGFTSTAHAIDYTWANGATGTWNTTNLLWTTTGAATAPDTAWANSTVAAPNNAFFTTAATVTLNGTLETHNLSFKNANTYTLHTGSPTEVATLKVTGLISLDATSTLKLGTADSNKGPVIQLGQGIQGGKLILGMGTTFALQQAESTISSHITTQNGAGGFVFTVNGGDNRLLKMTGALVLDAARTIQVKANTRLQIDGIISKNTTSAPLTKSGEGTLILSGNNTFDSFTASAGTTIFNTAGSMGTGSISLGAATIRFGSSFATARNITLTGAGTLHTGGNDITLSGVMSGTNNITYDGGGKIIITGRNTNSGNVIIQGTTVDVTNGTLAWAAEHKPTVDALQIKTGGKLIVSSLTWGDNTSLGKLSASNDGIMIQNGTLAISKTSNLSTSIKVVDNATFEVAAGALFTTTVNGVHGKIQTANSANANVTFTGQGDTMANQIIKVYGGKLIKEGTGTLTLNNTENAFTGGLEVRAGTLSVSNAAALSTGPLTLSGGRVASATATTTEFTSALTLSGSDISLGRTDGSDSLIFKGNINVAANKNALIKIEADTTFTGTFTNTATSSLTKEGSKTLVFNSTADNNLGKVIVTQGSARFVTTQSLKGADLFLKDSGNIDLGGLTTNNTHKITFNGGKGTLTGGQNYNGNISFSSDGVAAPFTGTATSDLTVSQLRFDFTGNESFGRLKVDGALSINESAYFSLTSENLTAKDIVSSSGVTLSNTAVISMDFAANVWNSDALSGTYQLFSTGVNLAAGDNRRVDQIVSLASQHELFNIDVTNFLSTGAISWKKLFGSPQYITVAEGANAGANYVPAAGAGGTTSYMAVDAGTVTFVANKTYDVTGQTAYRLSEGRGSLIFASTLNNTAELQVLGYSLLDATYTGQAGTVTLTNNANAQTKTVVTQAHLIVDSTAAGGAALATENVHILGAKEVYLYQDSTVELRAGGNTGVFTGAASYLYENDFIVNQTGTLLASGANNQTIFGSITNNKNLTIANASAGDLTLRGNITNTSPTGALAFEFKNNNSIILNGTAAGNAVYSLSTATDIVLRGEGTLSSINNYNITARGIIFSDEDNKVAAGSPLITGLSMSGGSLNIGNSGIMNNAAKTALINLDNVKINSQTNWSSDVLLKFTGEENEIDTDKYIVSLSAGIGGTGDLTKLGSGNLYIEQNGVQAGTKGKITLNGGHLWLGTTQPVAGVVSPSHEYMLGGNLEVYTGTLHGKIDANTHTLTFGEEAIFAITTQDNNHSSYIRNASGVTISDGAKLTVNAISDDWMEDGTPFELVSASGKPLNGKFIVEIANFALYDVVVSQNDKSITITSTKKGEVDFKPASSNEAGFQKMTLATLGSLVESPTGPVQGELYDILRNEVRHMNGADYGRYIREGAASTASLTSVLTGQVYNLTQHSNSTLQRINQASPQMIDTWGREAEYSFWAAGTSNYRDLESSTMAPGFIQNSWGATLGMMRPVSEKLMFGLGFAYSKTELNNKGNLGTTDMNSYNVDLFARYTENNWIASVLVSGGWTSSDIDRNQYISPNMGVRSAKGSADGSQLLATAEVGYEFKFGKDESYTVKPLVRMAGGYAKVDAFKESGNLGSAGYNVGEQEQNILTMGAGVELAKSFGVSYSANKGVVSLRALVTEELGDTNHSVNVHYIGAPAMGMSAQSLDIKSTAALISGSLIVPVDTQTSFFADVTGEFRSGQTGMSSSVGLSVEF